jgi:V8-like Glu-specific endopeptidase
MKKLLSLLLAALLLMPVLSFAETREQGGEGEVLFIDELPADADISSEIPDTNEPFIPEGLDRTIIGADNRVTVTNPASYPFSAIGYMHVTAECGCRWSGTGFMVTKNTMMTAAHCLICTKHNQWADKITVYFGYKNSGNYLYCYNSAWTAYVGTRFPDGYTDVNDWGYVTFKNSNVGDRTGWLGMDFLTDDELNKLEFYYIAGYRDEKLKYDLGMISPYDATRMMILGDTQPGNSGGPIFDSNNYAVGIIVSETVDENFGTRLTNSIYYKMHNEGII